MFFFPNNMVNQVNKQLKYTVNYVNLCDGVIIVKKKFINFCRKVTTTSFNIKP